MTLPQTNLSCLKKYEITRMLDHKTDHSKLCRTIMTVEGKSPPRPPSICLRTHPFVHSPTILGVCPLFLQRPLRISGSQSQQDKQSLEDTDRHQMGTTRRYYNIVVLKYKYTSYYDDLLIMHYKHRLQTTMHLSGAPTLSALT